MSRDGRRSEARNLELHRVAWERGICECPPEDITPSERRAMGSRCVDCGVIAPGRQRPHHRCVACAVRVPVPEQVYASFRLG